MSKKILIAAAVIVVLLVGLGVLLASQKQCPSEAFPQASAWELAWNDDFEGSELDSSRWIVADGYMENTVNAKQYDAQDEVFLEDGLLVIRSQKRDYGGKQYTSGRVYLQPEFSQTYGRFEIRAKLPAGKGMHSAFWLMGRDNWPPEIDVFEMLGRKPETIYMTNHWIRFDLPFRVPGLVALTRTFNQGKFAGQDYSQEFHTFAVEWTPDKITWFVDGVERFTSSKGVPCEPMYAILSSSVGDDWAQEPDGGIFPQHYYIDYIKVWGAN